MEANAEALERLISVTDNQNKYISLIIEQFQSSLKINGSTNFWRKYVECTRNSDKVNIVKGHFQWTPLDSTIKNKYKKDREISSSLRSLGNSAYGKKCYVDAVRWYNLAVMFAVSGGTELAFAYSNRSVALKYMGLLEEAMQDIDLALANGYPKDPSMLGKLNARRRQCEKELLDRRKYPQFEKLLEMEMLDRNTFYEDIFTLKAPNPLAPAVEDCVDIKFNPERGRHLIANRNIPMGATILVETPFVAVLEKALNWDADHCHYCFKHNFRCIPCPNCVFTQYCDESCRQQAYEAYHQYECPCLPELNCVLKDDTGKSNFYMAFKLICSLGPNKLFSMFCERKSNTSNFDSFTKGDDDSCCELIPGSDPETKIYASNSYTAFYNLMTTQIPRECYFIFLLSLTLSHTLDDETDYFKSITGISDSDQDKIDFQIFIAELIVHHFETFQRNSFGLNRITDMDGINLRTYVESEASGIEIAECGFDRFASAVYTTASLLNHSCDQNVMRFTGKKFGRMAIVAVKSLKEGEELLISYGQYYGSTDNKDTESRQSELSDNYKFLCDCIACTYDWPQYGLLVQRKPTFSCPSCASKYPHERKMSAKFLKCLLSGSFKCGLCKVQYSKENTETEYERQREAFEMCVQSSSFNNNPSIETFQYLKGILQYFETHVCPPTVQSVDGSHLYRDFINLIIFFADANV